MTAVPISRCAPVLLVLDDGQATSLDGLATSLAIFGGGACDVLYAPDAVSLRAMAGELATDRRTEALIVVDADQHPEPKALLAEAADLGFPLAVLSDGRSDAIHDHALSVGATAYLLSALPARELVDRLASLPAPCDTAPPVWGSVAPPDPPLAG